MDDLEQLNATLINCHLCPRLVAWREQVAREKRAAFMDETYWGRPVPIFGDPNARRLIVGLAPAAHGANRTGRMFTGDRSGDWLFRALAKAGVANQAHAENRFDGLELDDALIAASCHCAPPANKPLPEEIQNCSVYLRQLLNIRDFSTILCLGGVAWNHVHRLLGARPPKFTHGIVSKVGDKKVVASFHPSQQNTFTGKLTEAMLDAAIAEWLRDFVD